jgi:hypothetical protein
MIGYRTAVETNVDQSLHHMSHVLVPLVKEALLPHSAIFRSRIGHIAEVDLEKLVLSPGIIAAKVLDRFEHIGTHQLLASLEPTA